MYPSNSDGPYWTCIDANRTDVAGIPKTGCTAPRKSVSSPSPATDALFSQWQPDLYRKVGLPLREQGVGRRREPERRHDKQYDYAYVHEGDGTVAEAGERLARAAADAGADAEE